MLYAFFSDRKLLNSIVLLGTFYALFSDRIRLNAIVMLGRFYGLFSDRIWLNLVEFCCPHILLLGKRLEVYAKWGSVNIANILRIFFANILRIRGQYC